MAQRNDGNDGRSRNALSKYVVDRIVKLDVEGLKRVEIEERLGVCDETIRKYLREAGRPIHMIGMAVVKARKEGKAKR
jgi:predicted transcriptional regulator